VRRIRFADPALDRSVCARDDDEFTVDDSDDGRAVGCSGGWTTTSGRSSSVAATTAPMPTAIARTATAPASNARR
jgi:hypothetical protein